MHPAIGTASFSELGCLCGHFWYKTETTDSVNCLHGRVIYSLLHKINFIWLYSISYTNKNLAGWARNEEIADTAF